MILKPIDRRLLNFLLAEVERFQHSPNEYTPNPYDNKINEMQRELVPLLSLIFKKPKFIKSWLLSSAQTLPDKRPIDCLPLKPKEVISELYALAEGVYSK